MVKYYGRARQRTGSVNTNQIGLKMSGCPSKVGRRGVIDRYISRRSQCNQKYCGPVFYHGQLWSWNSQRCVAKVPRGQSFNAGVGHKSIPRFNCERTCAVGLDPNTAVVILKKYFNVDSGNPITSFNFILVGKTETLESDLSPAALAELEGAQWPIKHYYRGSPGYDALPVLIRNAVDVINGLKLKAVINPKMGPQLHVVGCASLRDEQILQKNGYGFNVTFAPKNLVGMYGCTGLGCTFQQPF